MKLWNLFKQKEPTQVVKEPALYFFYEDYLRIMLSPFENEELINKETEKELQFKERHSIKDGLHNIYIGEAALKSISERKIAVQAVEELLLRFGFKKFEKVYRFSTQWEEEFYNTFGFELDEAKVFVEYRGELVKNLWIESFRYKREKEIFIKLFNCLYEFGTSWNLILIDWNIEKIINLNSKDEIEKYLNVQT